MERVAGNGPDFQLNVAKTDPLNYAMRGLLYDLKKQKNIKAGGSGPVCSALVVYSYLYSLLKKKKVNVVPGFFNKLLVAVSKPFSKKFMAVNSGKLYAKSQSKRNF